MPKRAFCDGAHRAAVSIKTENPCKATTSRALAIDPLVSHSTLRATRKLDGTMPKPLKLVTSVASSAEAEIIRQLLLEAGIHSISQRNIGGPEWGQSGGQSVFVDEAQLDDALAVLKADEGAISDEELARQSEEAGRTVGEQ